MRVKVLPLVIGLLFTAGAFFLGASLNPPLTSYGTANQSAEVDSLTDEIKTNLLIDNGQNIIGYSNIILQPDESVLEMLQQVTQTNGLRFVFDPPEKSPLGAFVKQIGEEINGTDNNYWQYWINGSQPMIAADRYILKGGETVLWTFRKSSF